MSSDFQGMGWSFRDLVAPREEGGVVPSLFEDAVRQSVWLILATAPGERVMRPDFGCRIHDLLFATASATTIGLAALASGMAQARVGSAAMGAIAEKPELTGRAILLMAIPETLVVLGFAVAAMIILLLG